VRANNWGRCFIFWPDRQIILIIKLYSENSIYLPLQHRSIFLQWLQIAITKNAQIMLLFTILYGYETWSLKYIVGLVPNLQSPHYKYLHIRESSTMELREHKKELCTPRHKVLRWSIKSLPMGKTSSMQRQDDKVGAVIFITFLSQSSLIFKHGFRNTDTELHTPPSHTIAMPAVSCVRSQCTERQGGELLSNLKLQQLYLRRKNLRHGQIIQHTECADDTSWCCVYTIWNVHLYIPTPGLHWRDKEWHYMIITRGLTNWEKVNFKSIPFLLNA